MNEQPTPQLKRIYAMAAIEAERQGAIGIEIHHVLIAAMQEGANIAADLFIKQGISLDDLRNLEFEPKPKQPLQ